MTALHAQRIQLNAPLERGASGDVLDQRASADGKFLIYAADPGDSGFARLYRASLVDAQPVVDLGVAIWGSEPDFELSADGTRVVYRSSSDGTTPWELFSVGSDGRTAPMRLNGPLIEGGNVTSFRISADSQRVVYRADQQAYQRFELYAVGIAGGAVAKVNAPLLADGDVQDFEIGPDSLGVFYRARSTVGTGVDLLRGSVSGRQPAVRLTPSFGSRRGVQEFILSPDGTRVVYRADGLVKDQFQLYSVPADIAAAPVVLNQPLAAGGDVSSFELTDDGKSVVFLAAVRQDAASELFVVPMLGGLPPRRLHPLLGSGTVLDYRLEPLGCRVVFRLRPNRDTPVQLFSASLDAPVPATRIDLDDGVGSLRSEVHIAPAGGRVLYFRGGGPALYSTSLAGDETPILLALRVEPSTFVGFGADGRRAVFGLTSFLVDGSGPSSFLGGPSHADHIDYVADGSHIVAPDVLLYRLAHKLTQEVTRTDLHRVPIDGSQENSQVNPPFELGPTIDDVIQFQVAAGANRAAYLTRKGKVFGVELDGSPAPIHLNPGPEQDEDPYSALLASPDGRWVAFAEDRVPFVVPFSGEQAPVALAPSGSPLSFTPDSQRLLFVTPTATGLELFSALLGSAAPAVSLSGTLEVSSLSPFLISSDSSRVVFLVRGEIYSAACDGSTPAIGLGAQVGEVTLFRIPFQLQLSPDGQSVVCTGAVASEPAQMLLLSIPVDGSGPPVILDLLDAGNTWLEIDPSSQFVVYDHVSSAVGVSLRRVPIDGGAAPVLLLPPFAGSLLFDLSADGQRVLFVDELEYLLESPGGGIEGDGVAMYTYDVFSVPVDGSQQRQQFNALPAGPGWLRVGRHGDVHSGMPLFLGPDGHAVFLEEERLQSAPIDGSSATVDLTGGDAELVDRVAFGSRGRTAIFELPTPEGSALHAAATDGSRSTRLLSGIPVAGGEVTDFRVSADGSRVVYLGDLDEDGVDELFLSFLELPRRRATR